MNFQFRTFGLSAILIAAAATALHATTIDTYTISQPGYQAKGLQATLTGTFVGTVEDSGVIQLADLESLTVSLDFGPIGILTSTAVPFLFSFNTDPNFSGGSLELAEFFVPQGSGGAATSVLCIGLVSAFGLSGCGSGSVPAGATGNFGTVYTTVLPTVRLVNSEVLSPLQPLPEPPSGPVFTIPASNAPEPGTFLLLAIGLGAIVLTRAKIGFR